MALKTPLRKQVRAFKQKVSWVWLSQLLLATCRLAVNFSAKTRARAHTHALHTDGAPAHSFHVPHEQIVNGIELSKVMRTGSVATPVRNAIKLGVKLNKVKAIISSPSHVVCSLVSP